MSARFGATSQTNSRTMISTTSQLDPTIVYVSFRTTPSLQENQQ